MKPAERKAGGGGLGDDGDGKFFANQKKGEVAEMKADLNSTDRARVISAVKRVIAAMTVGKDVSTLFADVVKSMQTENLELKKLIYLYIINYARTQPDKAILIVNTFQKDATDRSPLIRALAIRTMGCIRVDKITEFLCEPLYKALKDVDPYVRKTAAVCVSKLYEINAELVEEQGFLESLRSLMTDANPMVVANAVAALAEIAETSGKDVIKMNASLLSKLLAALNECTEWGQVFLLDTLAKYEPSAKEAEDVIERVSPRLKHSNAAVAMSAVKVIVKFMKYMENPTLEKRLLQEKLPPPLITLLSEPKPEIQYVALRNTNLIVQKDPSILENGVKHFFCKYNDPIYVKLEKLEVMIHLANPKNIDKVLLELKEYATDVDVEFVRKSVSAIGRCAIKLEEANDRCIKVLVELIQTKVNYVVQEAIVVIRDVFRKYTNKYLTIINILCENLDSLDEPDAKAAMVWIIGEYANHIDNSHLLLENFTEQFLDETAEVQLALLSASVKLFLKRPEEGKDLVAKVLNMATEQSENPDLRDRGYIYWRLLSSNPETAQAVVLGKKPTISDDMFHLDPAVFELLLSNLNTLSSIYHKPAEMFVAGGKASIVLKPTSAQAKPKRRAVEESSDSDSDDSKEKDKEQREEGPKGNASGSDEGEANSTDSEGGKERKKAAATASPGPDRHENRDETSSESDSEPKTKGAGASGAAGAGPGAAAQPHPTTSNATNTLDLLSADLFGPTTSAPPVDQKPVVLNARQGKGLQIRSIFTRRNKQCVMDMVVENQSSFPMTNFAIKFNTNFVGVQATRLDVGQLSPGESREVLMPLQTNVDIPPDAKPGVIQMAIKTDPLGVLYFQDKFPVHALYHEDGLLEKTQFLQMWGGIGDTLERTADVPACPYANIQEITNKLGQLNVFHIATRVVAARGEVAYFSLQVKATPVLAELALSPAKALAIAAKSNAPALAALVAADLAAVLATR